VNRTEKAAEVETLQQAFQQAKNTFLVGFSGLTVGQVNELRRKVRDTSSYYRVVKNRLALRAVEGTSLEPLAGQFRGPTAVAYNDGDPVALAKALADFAKNHPALRLRAAVVEGEQVLDAAGLDSLARMPSLPALRAQILGVIQAPAERLVRLLSTPAYQLARVLDARQEQLTKSAG
jgi:large subunit ribosomal protein L10